MAVNQTNLHYVLMHAFRIKSKLYASAIHVIWVNKFPRLNGLLEILSKHPAPCCDLLVVNEQ